MKFPSSWLTDKIFQALIPAASMLIPISVYLLGYLSGYQDILKSTTMELIAILLVGGYPFFNSIFCLYSMRPYRVFCKQLWRRATCRTAVDPTVVLLSTASTSGSSPGNFRWIKRLFRNPSLRKLPSNLFIYFVLRVIWVTYRVMFVLKLWWSVLADPIYLSFIFSCYLPIFYIFYIQIISEKLPGSSDAI